METITNSVSSVQQRTPTKRSKAKKKNNKPIKVVYISNPMKVKTSASEFRALVQELTGQDAESPPNPSRFQLDPSGGGGGGDGNSWHHRDSENCLRKIGHLDESDDHTLVAPPQVDPSNSQGQLPAEGGSSTESCFDPFGDVFTSQMIENISAFFPASVFYESPQEDEVLLL